MGQVIVWLRQPPARQLEYGHRLAALDEFAREFEAEFSVITHAGIESATRPTRAAVVVRSLAPDGSARAKRRSR